MRARFLTILAATAILATAGCSDDPQPQNEPVDTLNRGTVDTNPTVDADPTPKSGSGGSIPLNDPDGTTNGAPAASGTPAPSPPPAPAAP